MALGDAYATVADLEARLGADTGSFATLLDAASRAVEAFTRRQFNQTVTASPRQYRPDSVDVCRVHDFYTVTDLVVASDNAADGTFGTTWAAADFVLEPANGIEPGSGIAGFPYREVRATGSKSFPRLSWRKRTVQVTARWGWTAVPVAIKEATLDVASSFFYGAGGSAGQVSSEAIDGYSVSYVTAGAASAASSSTVPPEMLKAVPYQLKQWGVA